LVHHAFHDDLTGLPNRALLSDRATRALSRERAVARRHVAALFLDLDDFKGVNDSLGHEAGDVLLTEVARRLRDALRPQDTVARLGGDEFAVLLEELTDPGDAVQAAERVLLALSPPIAIAGRELYVRVSIGVAVAEAGASADDLLRNADVAMYQVKGSGKDGFRSFEGWMHADAVERLELEEDLREAIEGHEIELHYQPIVDLQTGDVTGVEALARWLHPRRGPVSPDEFIPLAEATGLIVPLGRWVLDAACARLRLLEDAALIGPDFEMGVNVSAGQFLDAGFAAHVQGALNRHGVAPRRLVVEITETLLMGDVDTSRSTLRELRAMGVRVALDDFGTGYSSLSYLRQFPIDVLKIDRVFVGSITDDDGEHQLVEAIIGLGHTLGLRTVAEGMEHDDQRVALQALGCDLGQGFHFARPVGGDALSLYLAERRPVPARR
nr:EAL domain-containing protein [Solirubrobacterales bacterium]